MLLLAMRINPLYAWTLVLTVAVAAIAAAVNLQLAFFVGWFAILAWWSWQNPTPAVYLLFILAPLLPMFKITQTAGNITLVKDVIILTLFLKLVVLPFLRKTLPYRRNILLLPLLFLVGWVAVTTLTADSLLVGILRARDIVLYALFYMVVLYLPKSGRWYRAAFWWGVASVTIVALLGWYQFFVLPDSTVLRFNPARHIWIPRVSSIMAHPSILGQYLVTASLLCTALALVRAGREKLLATVGIVALVPLVYLTYSRAVWLGYVAGMAIMALTWGWSYVRASTGFKMPWKSVGGAIIVFVVLLGVVVQFSSLGVFVRSAFDPTYASNAERLEFLARLLAPLTPAQALFGAGLGDVAAQNFREVDINTFDIASGASRIVQLAKNATLVDNQHLKTFIEMGFMGLLIYVWIYWRFFTNAFRLVFRKNEDQAQFSIFNFQFSKTIGLWGIGFLTAFLIQGFFIDIWDIFPTNLFFWFIAALVSREQTSYTEEHEG